MYSFATIKQSLQVTWSYWNDFNADKVQQVAPVEAGVYVLATKLTNGNLRVFYVGQTINLDKRLKEHLSDSEPNVCIKNNVTKYACMFRYAKVSSSSDRDKAERALYKKFTPSCNDAKAIPDVDDVDINF
jgi:excinuclease UvrABC nuclease subunit